MTSLRNYFHVYEKGKWKRPVREHFEAIAAAGVPFDHITLGVVGDQEPVSEFVRQYWDDSTTLSIWSTQQEDTWEQFTLDLLWNDCKELDDFYGMYGHTKGAAFPSELNDMWRAVMTKFTIANWEECVQALDDGNAAVGPFFDQYMERQTHFFAGNFWWVRSDELRELGQCSKANRYRAETWVGGLSSLHSRPVHCTHKTKLDKHQFQKFLP